MLTGIYYGDEVATTSTWVRGGSDAVLRPPMSPRDLHLLDTGAGELLASVRQLGAFRRANTWLTSAELGDVTTPSGALTYVVTGDGGSIRVRVNPTVQTVRFPPDEQRREPVLGTATPHPGRIDVPPRGWAVHSSHGPSWTDQSRAVRDDGPSGRR